MYPIMMETESASGAVKLGVKTAGSETRVKMINIKTTTLRQLLSMVWEEFKVPAGIETRLWLNRADIGRNKEYKVLPMSRLSVSLENLGVIEQAPKQQIIFVQLKTEEGSGWSSCSEPGIAKSSLETDLNSSIIPSLENITRTVDCAKRELENRKSMKQEELQNLDAVHADESRALALKHKEEKKKLSLKHKRLIDEAERRLDEHKKVKTEAQVKIHETFGTGPAKIPECSACLEPMLPPVKIFSCERGHLICETCKPRVVANTCVVCRSPGGQSVRALAVENLINQIVG